MLILSGLGGGAGLVDPALEDSDILLNILEISRKSSESFSKSFSKDIVRIPISYIHEERTAKNTYAKRLSKGTAFNRSYYFY